MKFFYKYYLAALFLGFTIHSIAGSTGDLLRTVALLDVTDRNNETSSAELISAEHVLKVSGISYIKTSDLQESFSYAVILLSSELQPYTFRSAARDSLLDYVNQGGVLIVPQVHDPFFHELFGISDITESVTNFSIEFQPGYSASRWLEDSLESTISLGNPLSVLSTVKTNMYTVSTASILARYENNRAAITRNNFGEGMAYSLGFSFKSLVLTNQLNRDYEANRVYSGFEPTTDAVILFIKGICAFHIPHSVWLHTSPNNSKASLLVTHDIDATSTVDSMYYFANYEKRRGVKASYMITTKYFNDRIADFYIPANFDKIRYVMDQGHSLGSHTVGHFRDFDNEAVFSFGSLGNTKANYSPYSSSDVATTTGATVLAECELSQKLLREDFQVNVTSFRTGHLLYNDRLANALDTLGYKVNSSNVSGDVLTNFPYRAMENRSFEGRQLNVWEIPVTISDITGDSLLSVDGIPGKVNEWLSVLNKNAANHAPSVLLIHPNRFLKLAAEHELFNKLPEGMYVCDLDTYAEFWIQRDLIRFTSTLSNNEELVITFQHPLSALPKNLSLVVDKGNLINDHITAKDINGNIIPFRQSSWNTNDVILYFEEFAPLKEANLGPTADYLDEKLYISSWPNPVKDNLIYNIEFKDGASHRVRVFMYDILGRPVKNLTSVNTGAGQISLTETISMQGMQNGTYILVFEVDEVRKAAKKLIKM